MNKKPFVIGIAGASGSGKTYFLKCFLNHFNPGEVCVISQDDYYKKKEFQCVDENGKINFDLPEGIDDKELLENIQQIISGNTIQKKEYTFNVNEDKARILTIKPAPVIIVEGLFIFHYPLISELFNMRIFMEADEEVALNRRIKRDNEERGYDPEMVMYQWVNHVIPAYNAYLLPYKDTADKIILNNSDLPDDIIKKAWEISHKIPLQTINSNQNTD